MKTILSISFFLSFLICLGQVPERQILKGKIKVPDGSDVMNINVYNIDSQKGTNTNVLGEFLIRVKEKDHLIISSVQFQKFEVEMTKEIIDEMSIVINIRQNVNQLNEVTVSSNVLSGNLDVDVKKINTNSVSLNIDQNELINGYDADITIDSQIRTNNIAIDNDYLDYPMDFVQIFKRYIQKKDKKKRSVSKDADLEVRKMYDNTFFKDNFDIEEDKINEFLFFAINDDFDNKLLKKGNEMDLIEHLLKEAEKFNTNTVKLD